jgi:hypothetical protein
MVWQVYSYPYLERWIAELGLKKEWHDALGAAGPPEPT